jgi:hypothetical protein
MAEKKSGTGMPGAHFAGSQHPPEYREDLNPKSPMSADEVSGAMQPRQLSEIKEAHERLPQLTNAELRDVPVLREGDPLRQGREYIDLAARQPRPFKAMGGMTAGAENWYVPKSETDYVLWNRLTGVTDPARLDQAG